MRLRKIFFAILIKLKIPIIFSISFLFILIIKRNNFPGTIFFEGLFSLLFVTIAMLFYFVFYENEKSKKISNVYKIIISLLILLTFHTTVITIVDRSISIFILNEIKNHNSNKNSIRDKFINNFTYKSIDKRISEQEEMGNIISDNENIILTNKGEIYYSTFYFLKVLFNTDTLIINKKSNE